jgi:hypothetical protein
MLPDQWMGLVDSAGQPVTSDPIQTRAPGLGYCATAERKHYWPIFLTMTDPANPSFNGDGFAGHHCQLCGRHANPANGADDQMTLGCRSLGWPSNASEPLAVYQGGQGSSFLYTPYSQELCASLGVVLDADRFGAYYREDYPLAP